MANTAKIVLNIPNIYIVFKYFDLSTVHNNPLKQGWETRGPHVASLKFDAACE